LLHSLHPEWLILSVSKGAGGNGPAVGPHDCQQGSLPQPIHVRIPEAGAMHTAAGPLDSAPLALGQWQRDGNNDNYDNDNTDRATATSRNTRGNK